MTIDVVYLLEHMNALSKQNLICNPFRNEYSQGFGDAIKTLKIFVDNYVEDEGKKIARKHEKKQ